MFLNNINKLSSYHKKSKFPMILELDSLSSKKWSSKKKKPQKEP